MPRASRTGIRGLYVDEDGRRRIDLRYKLPDGTPGRHKEVFPPGTPARAAETRARDVLAAAIRGELRPRTGESPKRLKEAFAEFTGLRPTGNKKQRERHCATLLASLGDVPLDAVSEIAVERFTRTRKDAKKSNATVNRELQTLKAFYIAAIEWGWADARPKIRLLKEEPGRVRWLEDKERARLYAELPPRIKRVVLAAALSGQRLGNVVALTRDRVDFAHASFWIPKTKSGKRHDVPISAELDSVIREAIADGDTIAESKGYAKPSHVFVSRFGKPYTSSGVTSLFRKVAERAAVDDFRFHDLRHDFATRVRRAGHGLDVVQALLGHATPVMTQRYAHLGRAELHRAVASVAPALPPGSQKSRRKRAKK